MARLDDDWLRWLDMNIEDDLEMIANRDPNAPACEVAKDVRAMVAEVRRLRAREAELVEACEHYLREIDDLQAIVGES
jgi:hypothetical protein